MSALGQLVRTLVGHALPVLVAQLASIGMMVVDTIVLGHVGSVDLAAIAIGGGVHISLVFALVGVLQSVGPVVARLHGAKRDAEVGPVLQQGIWLALMLSVPGALFLLYPGWWLVHFGIDPAVDFKVRQYLALLAIGLPFALCYRTFAAFCNAIGRPVVLMAIGLAALPLHALLAWGFAARGWTGQALGVLGCALSNVVIGGLACLAAVAYLHWGRLGQSPSPFSNWRKPEWRVWQTLLRLGLPMGVSNFVEITAFTLISLFIAALGPDVVAGHRIAANFSALAYMPPLSLGIATMAVLGQSVGARDWSRAWMTIRAGLLLAGGSSLLLGVLMWLAATPLVAIYTDDAGVRGVAVALVVYIAIYQFFDALQTIAGHALRACHVTLVPMLLQTACFWGVGLLGGGWLCYRWPQPMGVAGFWLAAAVSLMLAAILLLPLLFRVLRSLETDP